MKNLVYILLSSSVEKQETDINSDIGVLRPITDYIFTRESVVSFGNYLLKKYGVMDQHGQREITHADVEAWLEQYVTLTSQNVHRLKRLKP